MILGFCKILLRKNIRLLTLLKIIVICFCFKAFIHLTTYNQQREQFNIKFTEYENVRINLLHESLKFWNITSNELVKIIDISLAQHTNFIKNIIKDGEERNRSLIDKIEYLSELDGYNNWRINNEAIRYLNKPNKQYEITRRQIGYEILEFRYYLNSQLQNFKKNTNMTSDINFVLETAFYYIRLSLKYYHQLPYVDGFNDWRKNVSIILNNYTDQMIYESQNKDEDCEKSRRLLCPSVIRCGLGCMSHHMIKCMAYALGTNRTLVYNLRMSGYAGIQSVFLPNSETCTSINGEADPWPGTNKSDFLKFGKSYAIEGYTMFHPLQVPTHLSEILSILHGDPRLWWVGQLFKYFMRPTEKLNNHIKNTNSFKNFTSPIVGVHIRRSDKLNVEAKYHDVKEYMNEVDEYYKQLQVEGTNFNKKKIYLATDDPTAYDDIKNLVIFDIKVKITRYFTIKLECNLYRDILNRYPEYEVIYEKAISNIAKDARTRYTEDSLYGALVDLYFLYHSDFIVCTLSSTFCRMAYALRQTLEVDGSEKLRSLDDTYWYSDQIENSRISISNHNKTNEINFIINDTIRMDGNHWDGYSKGKNLRTNKEGLFPSFKTQLTYGTIDYPQYINFTLP